MHLKKVIKKEENETVTNCHDLKLKAHDGKYCMFMTKNYYIKEDLYEKELYINWR